MSQEKQNFIFKIVSMLEKYPAVIGWNENGLQLEIKDKKQFSQSVLNQYFRHNKFQSFVRQLNMYSFHKVCLHKNSISFKHDIFYRGNQAEFKNIRRKKKGRFQQNLNQNNSQDQLQAIFQKKYDHFPQSIAKMMKQLIKFKNDLAFEVTKLKKNLQIFHKDVNTRKFKQMKPDYISIKECIQLLESQIKKCDFQLQKFRQNVKIQDDSRDMIQIQKNVIKEEVINQNYLNNFPYAQMSSHNLLIKKQDQSQIKIEKRN